MVKKKQRDPVEAGGRSDSSEDAPPPPCHHVKKAVDLGRLKKALKGRPFKVECPECPEGDGSTGSTHLWICLACGSQLCERGRGGHALRHYETPRSETHALVARSDTFDVYCYACNKEVDPTSQFHRRLLECVEQLRRWGSSGERSSSPERRPAIALGAPPSPPPFAEPSVSPSPSPPPPGGNPKRVRGLTNLGNTCFFNSVLQCLAQTPHLVGVLKETERGGETFTFAGGKVTVPPPPPVKTEDGEEPPEPEKERAVEVPPVTGELDKWGNITEILTDALQEIHSSARADVFSPKRLLNAFIAKVPHFGGGDQHDSHELLRHLLEAVRSEDLRRYQSIILKKLGLENKKNRENVSEETKQTIKFYAAQASDSIIRPGQVFRGMLVSTLECQDCKHSSKTTEHFLDLSLPITADKPQPPAVQRRIMQEEQNSSNPNGEQNFNFSKKGRKHKNKKGANDGLFNKSNDADQSADGRDNKNENKSSSEQSDADIEDNADDNPKWGESVFAQRNNKYSTYLMESGYNSEKVISSDSIRASPVADEYKEKGDTSPERMDKDSEDGKFGPAMMLPYNKTFNAGGNSRQSNPDSGVASPETSKNVLSDTINMESPITSKDLGSPVSLSSEIYMDMSSPRQGNNSPALVEVDNMIATLDVSNHSQNLLNNVDKNNDGEDNEEEDRKSEKECERNSAKDRKNRKPKYEFSMSYLNSFENQPENSNSAIPLKLNSPDFESNQWKKDTSPFVNRNNAMPQRSLSEEGEYSVQSCLKQFTSSELLTGNNKVGCEACTKRVDNGKSVYTNATKKFLIQSTPAVLILHLKRFQLGGPRNVLRKITKHVNFPLILDVAPFCENKPKTASGNPNKMLYSLYGVVEHSGSTLQFGHYVAYVKVRPEVTPGDSRWDFLPGNKNKEEKKASELVNGTSNTNDNDTDSSLSGYESGEGAIGGSEVEPLAGKWYYISDSRVMEISEEKVLKVQAYLLFYERVL